jgi:glycosyltransferase involved in cell wall biosynthesis
MLGPAPAPIIEHLPTYDPNQFAGLRPPLRQSGEPFTVLFVGRLEANKGIFDVLQIAEELQAERRGEFRFDICGDGSARDRFLSLVDEKGLGDSIVYHGYCDAAKLREIIETAHVFIVPTRSEFEAGFEMTCAESILSGRPLVTSQVAPAIEYLGQAAIEVPPDDVPAYKAAITSLADDAQLYDQKARGCALAAGMFLDESNSWSRAMIEALGKAGVHADGQVNRPLA